MGKTENENGANVSLKLTPEDIARAQAGGSDASQAARRAAIDKTLQRFAGWSTSILPDTLYRRFVLGSTPFGDTSLWSYDDTLKDEALGFRPMSEYRPAPKMLDSREPAPGVHPAAPNMLARWQS